MKMLRPSIPTEAPYTYTVLRYVHDVGTAEFINVGVVVAACDMPLVRAKFKTDYGRVKGAFPSLDTEVFLARMKRLQACINAIDAERCLLVHAQKDTSLHTLIRSVVALEDRALCWSPTCWGSGGPLSTILELLYARFVTRHDPLRRR